MKVRLLLLLVVLAAIVVADDALFTTEEQYTAGHVLLNYHNRSFVTPGVSSGRRALPATRLAWVTPKSARGYARLLASPRSWTHVAPCWFEVKGKPSAAKVVGAEDINFTWLKQVAKTDVVVVPQVTLRLKHTGRADVVPAIVDAVTAKDAASQERRLANLIGGVTLDMSSITMRAQHEEQVTKFLVSLRQALADALERDDVAVIVVLSANTEKVGPAQLRWLAPLVDLIAVKTFDFNAAAHSPRENAPFEWIKETVDALLKPSSGVALDRRKLLVGLNLQGYRWGGGLPHGPPEPIDGDGVIQRLLVARDRARVANSSISPAELAKKPVIHWASSTKEHNFEHYVPKKGVEWVLYPSIASLLHRVHFAGTNGLGVAAWELGQGLEYFLPVFAPR